MKKMLCITILSAFVAGCTGGTDDNDDGGDSGGGGNPDPVANAAVVVGDVTSAAFDNDGGTLAVRITLDGDDALQQYVAAGTLNGYSRFTQQDDGLDRAFTALAGESADGSVQAVVAMDGGQFNRYFGGAVVNQDSYTAPTSGLASYAGAYVGLVNIGPAAGSIPAGADPSLYPFTTTDVTGSVFLNADFTDNQVNGSIYDRVFDPDGDAFDLQTIVLTATAISGNGGFSGDVELGDLTNVGSYDGAFGGANAANVAGVVSLGEGLFEGSTVPGADDFENEAEIGIFVIGQCPAGGAACFGTE